MSFDYFQQRMFYAKVGQNLGDDTNEANPTVVSTDIMIAPFMIEGMIYVDIQLGSIRFLIYGCKHLMDCCSELPTKFLRDFCCHMELGSLSVI